jgi:alpha-N-arabinofuranosidase
VVQIAGSEIDFLAVHCAYAPALYQDLGWDSRTVYAATLAAPSLIARQLNDLSRHLDALTPSRPTPIRIAVTEWGPYFQTAPSSRFIDHPKTLASALFAASTLKTFIESTRTDIADMFKLVESTYMGWIGIRNGAYAPKASLLAFQMFRSYFGTNLVSTTTVSPTYDSPTIGWVDAAGPVSFLDVVTSRSSDSKTLYVMGINKHFDRDITAHIHIQNFTMNGRATVYTLNGTAPDANTGTQLPSYPGLTWATQAVIGPFSRFQNGGPLEVSISSSSLTNLTSDFDFVFRAHSVTSIALPSR